MKKMIYAIMVLTILLGFNLKAEAASMDYGVKSILPENQLNKKCDILRFENEAG